MNNNNGAKLNNSSNGKGVAHSPAPPQLTNQHNSEILPIPQNTNSSLVSTDKFSRPVILKQSPIWSRAILWGLIGVTCIALIWACEAKIEEAIPAQGKLEPIDAVKEVQAPVGGVVKAIYVQDGQKVHVGEQLIGLEPTAAQAQLDSLHKIRTSLLLENQFYRTVLNGNADSIIIEQEVVQLKLPAESIALTKNRTTLAAENQLYRAQLGNTNIANRLSIEQLNRLHSNQAELNSRIRAAQSEVVQLTKQLEQSSIKLASAKDTLALNEGLLKDMKPLGEVGAISKLQYIKQQQDTRTSQADADGLIQEGARIKAAINEAQTKVENIVDVSRKELLTQIAENDKRLAEIDSQLTKVIVENNKKVAETDSQLTQAQVTLKYQEIKAPVSGTVFDLQAHSPGFVTTTSQAILKIVPDGTLTAKVFITNKDIGFVKEGMQVDVRIDSFPFSEFGDIKGQLVWIGSDALPPDQINPYYRFPAKVLLEKQSLIINGRVVQLQSGMSINANIKVRSRTVMSIFTDLFTQNLDNLKSVR